MKLILGSSNSCCLFRLFSSGYLLKIALLGDAENDGHENDGPSKLQGMKLRTWNWRTKLQGMKIQDKNSGHENAGHEIGIHDKYLFIVVSTSPSNFSSIVENLM